MKKVFLAAAIVLLGSLQASGVPPSPGPAPPLLGLVPPKTAPVPQISPNARSMSHTPYSLMSPESGVRMGPTATIPSTPIQVAPAPLGDFSMYPQAQGALGPAAQNQFGLSLGFPLGEKPGGGGATRASSPGALTRGNAK